MNSDAPPSPNNSAQERTSETFRDRAHQQQPSVLHEFWDFLRHNRKWWLTPLVLALLMLSGLMVLTQTAAAPFIYVLF